MNEENKSKESSFFKRLFHRMNSQRVGLLPLSIIFLFTILAFVVVQSMLYHNIFEPRHTETRQYMFKNVSKNIQKVTERIEHVLLNRFENQKELKAALDSLNSRLVTLATHLTDVAIADRSSSLDNIFERFSMLVAVVALIFGGFGIFTSIQYRDQLNQMKEELKRIQQEYTSSLIQIKDAYESHMKRTKEEIENSANEAKSYLNEASKASMSMIWMVANHLEQMINLDVVEKTHAKNMLQKLFLDGFRLELYSNNPNERISALHNIYAQGTCDDLPKLLEMYRDENENIKKLVYRAIKKILLRCQHQDKHTELLLKFGINNGFHN